MPARGLRRRSAAVARGIFEDAVHADRFRESFLVDSWLGDPRQRKRVVVVDRAWQERVQFDQRVTAHFSFRRDAFAGRTLRPTPYRRI